MKTKTSLVLFVALHDSDNMYVLQDENNELPKIDLIDLEGNFLCTPEQGLMQIVKKFFRLDYDYVVNQVSQTYIGHEDGEITIYHKVVLIKSTNFFNDEAATYILMKDKIANDDNYTQLCGKFGLLSR